MAIYVAIFGLAVNLLSIFILGGGHDHEHEHEHSHEHEHAHEHEHSHEHEHAHEHGHGREHRHDYNFKAAYMHVLADALTSVLAIGALLCGLFLGWRFLDPAMGVAGGLLILNWAWKLLRDTGAILLDADEGGVMRKAIVAKIEADGVSRIVDLHVWRIGSHEVAALAAVDGHASAKEYRSRLSGIEDLRHLNIEVRAPR
jgi:cation diffusion facilitator family transporter